MIEASFFYNELIKHGTDFFAGVPDSLLKSFCAYVTDNSNESQHIIAVNEGAAVALASGYHLATGKIPLVYMQNSGLGNAVNPLLSLVDSEVYRIPIVLVIGWRGEPGTHDEPQHIKQGKVTCTLLETLGIPYVVLSKETSVAEKQIGECYDSIKQTGSAFAIVVQKDTFAPYVLQKKIELDAEMKREEAIDEIIKAQSKMQNSIIVSTTGMASRELYELREKYKMGHERDFLTVGSMGHASEIALGIAMQKQAARVTILDGDGAALMHLGNLAAIGVQKPRNLRHVVLNNGAHDSVGGQPTIAPLLDLCAIARACGYVNVFSARNKTELQNALNKKQDALTFIEVVVKKGARGDLGRPASSPENNKIELMKLLKDIGGIKSND